MQLLSEPKIVDVDENNSDYLSSDSQQEQAETTSSYSVQQRLCRWNHNIATTGTIILPR